MSGTIVNKKSLLISENFRAVCFWISVLALYLTAMCFHGSVMTNDEYTHWIAGVYLGICQPSGMDILEFPGVASGKVPHLIWGNIGRILGYHPMIFRAINVILSLSFAFIYWILIRKRVKRPYIVMAFLLTYVYFFLPAHSILTDNIGPFFLIVFFALTLNERSVTALRGVIGLIALCLALYTRVWYIVFPFAFLLIAILSFRQRPNLAKIAICLLGLLSIFSLVVYWGGFVQPLYQSEKGHHVAVTIWLAVLVISTLGIYLWPLVFFMPIKRAAWIVMGFLSPFFLGFIYARVGVTRDIIGGLATNTLYYIGEAFFGSQAANWIFFPFWIIGLVLLIHILMLWYEEIWKIPVWSESPPFILAVASLGFIGVNLLTPMWSERYLAPFFICFFPFIPNLIKRWKKAIWIWIFVLFIIALGHLAIQSFGYKRGTAIRYENLESTLTEDIAALKGDDYTYLVKEIHSCLKNDR